MYTPPIDPRSIISPSREIYAAMGEEAIVRMIHDLYAELEKSSIRPMFGRDMAIGAERSAAFFVGLLGGPPRYHERYGNPMMRARHMPFPIDMNARSPTPPPATASPPNTCPASAPSSTASPRG
jgi:hemoglobin